MYHFQRRSLLTWPAVGCLVAFSALSAEAQWTPAVPNAGGQNVPSGQRTPAPSNRGAQAAVQQGAAALRRAVPDESALRDAAERERLRPQAIEAGRALEAILEASPLFADRTQSSARAIAAESQRRGFFEPLLVAIGDEVTIKRLKAESTSEEANLAAISTLQLIVGSYVQAATEAEQLASLQRYDDLLTARLADAREVLDFNTRVLAQKPALSEGVTDRLIAVLQKHDTGRRGQGTIDQIQGARKQASALNQPLVLEGVTPDGKPFTTADWKGKVILIDYWATWCGPCIAELPKLIGLYEKYHAEGFEILGISNDQSAEALERFLAGRPEIRWPHLFDAEAASARQWHPITRSFGINGIPVLYLIDRNGVLRSVTARRDLETLIPQLLAESAG